MYKIFPKHMIKKYGRLPLLILALASSSSSYSDSIACSKDTKNAKELAYLIKVPVKADEKFHQSASVCSQWALIAKLWK